MDVIYFVYLIFVKVVVDWWDNFCNLVYELDD